MATKKERAIEIRTATLPGENTPERVGSLLEDMVDHQDRVDTSLETFTDELAETNRTIEENKAQAAAKIRYMEQGMIALTNHEGAFISTDFIPLANTSARGLMAAADKRKLETFTDELGETNRTIEENKAQAGANIRYMAQGMIALTNHEGAFISTDFIPLAKTSARGLMAAADKKKLDGMPASIFEVLIPTDLKVSCIERITISNVEPVYIKTELSPATVLKNIIFISDNRAALVDADGKITPVADGKSRISIIPTCNTALAKTILIEVGRPLARLVNSESSIRRLSSGLPRLT